MTNFYNFARSSRLVRVTKGGKTIESAFLTKGDLANKDQADKSNAEAHKDYLHAKPSTSSRRAIPSTTKKKRPRNSEAANIEQVKEVLADRAVVSAKKKMVLFHNPASKLDAVQDSRAYVHLAELVSNFNPDSTTLASSKIVLSGEVGGVSAIGNQKTSRLDAALVGLGHEKKMKTLKKYTTDLNSNKTSHRLVNSLMSASHRLFHAAPTASPSL